MSFLLSVAACFIEITCMGLNGISLSKCTGEAMMTARGVIVSLMRLGARGRDHWLAEWTLRTSVNLEMGSSAGLMPTQRNEVSNRLSKST